MLRTYMYMEKKSNQDENGLTGGREQSHEKPDDQSVSFLSGVRVSEDFSFRVRSARASSSHSCGSFFNRRETHISDLINIL